MSAGRSGGTYAATNTPLRFLILTAFNLEFEPFRLTGGPDWIDSERFDILGALPVGAKPADTTKMLRTLLEERFHLVVHTEKREIPIFALMLARADGKLGPRLTRSTTDCAALVAKSAPGAPVPPRADGRPTCGTQASGRTIQGGGRPLSALATILSQHVSRRVEDRTGLAGSFDFDLEFEQSDRGLRTDAAAADAPTIFTALQEQLGLKLESTRGPADIYIIDRVERPTDN